MAVLRIFIFDKLKKTHALSKTKVLFNLKHNLKTIP